MISFSSLTGQTFLVHDLSGSLLPELEEQGAMRRNDYYIPVSCEEKAADFGNTKDGGDSKYNKYDSIVSGLLYIENLYLYLLGIPISFCQGNSCSSWGPNT